MDDATDQAAAALSGASSAVPEISVVVPARDEAENLPLLIEEIAAALGQAPFEVIIVDDGSRDATPKVLAALRAEGRPWLRHLRHRESCGQSASVRTGLLAARGEIVCTLDGDGQNDPAYLPALVAALRQAGPNCGLAQGQRTKRTDSPFKRLASRIANAVRGAMLADGTRDSGCGLKALPRHVFLRLPYFDSWHRFIPALVIREGFTVTHVDVTDRQRRHGKSKYGIWDRFWVGVVDLLGVYWLRRRRRRVPVVEEVGGHG